MKFEIDGKEYNDFELSNEQIVRLLDGDYEVTDMGRDFLMKKVYERFKGGFVHQGIFIEKAQMFLIDKLKEIPMGNNKMKIKSDCSLEEFIEDFKNYMEK